MCHFLPQNPRQSLKNELEGVFRGSLHWGVWKHLPSTNSHPTLCPSAGLRRPISVAMLVGRWASFEAHDTWSSYLWLGNGNTYLPGHVQRFNELRNIGCLAWYDSRLTGGRPWRTVTAINYHLLGPDLCVPPNPRHPPSKFICWSLNPVTSTWDCIWK